MVNVLANIWYISKKLEAQKKETIWSHLCTYVYGKYKIIA